MSETTTTTKATTRIVIVSGNEYQVPIENTEAELRAHLSTMFPDIANASLQKGKRTVEGVEYETWEFVKRAGTKGASGAELAALIAQVPPLIVAPLPAPTMNLIKSWRYGKLTVEEALRLDFAALIASLPISHQDLIQGETLCSQLDALPGVPGSTDCGW